MSTFSDVGQGLGGFFAVCSAVVVASRKKIQRWWQARSDFRSRLHDLAYGLDGVDGMTADVPMAVVRIANLEAGQARLEAGQGRIEEQLREVLSVAQSALSSVARIEGQVTPNGGKKNTLGDIARRDAEQKGIWLLDAPENGGAKE